MIKFWLNGRVIPKPRPRVTRRGTYMPSNYIEWRNQQIAYLYDQDLIQQLQTPVSISVIFVGFLQGDADNVIGAIMDLLVEAKLIPDDSPKYVPKIVAEYQKSSKQKGAVVIIEDFKFQKFIKTELKHNKS